MEMGYGFKQEVGGWGEISIEDGGVLEPFVLGLVEPFDQCPRLEPTPVVPSDDLDGIACFDGLESGIIDRCPDLMLGGVVENLDQ
jgi:hypothetical protein